MRHTRVGIRRPITRWLPIGNLSSVLVAALLALGSTCAATAGNAEVQARIDTDVAQGAPIVVHVVVALCDNVNQGIVPVPAALGNGQDPRSNLYWGALYGIRTHLTRTAGWTAVTDLRPRDPRILERRVFRADLRRDGRIVPVYLIADAWDGAYIRDALCEFLHMAAGASSDTVSLPRDQQVQELPLGGRAHLLAYVGHNGLMDFELPPTTVVDEAALPRAAMVLACASRPYFRDRLLAVGVHPLLMTTGLMAPEAYTQDAAVRAWISDRTTTAVVAAAAAAYDRYQHCGARAAVRLY
jgi:hypothetical protein